MKALAGEKLNVAKMIISVFNRVENILWWKRENASAFSPFPTMFSKAFALKVVKCRNCAVKNQPITTQ